MTQCVQMATQRIILHPWIADVLGGPCTREAFLASKVPLVRDLPDYRQECNEFAKHRRVPGAPAVVSAWTGASRLAGASRRYRRSTCSSTCPRIPRASGTAL